MLAQRDRGRRQLADLVPLHGGRDELRELRLSRRSSSATRASSRRFASTSSPIRISSATAASRSPSRIASASARSIPPNFGATQRVPAQGLNAYPNASICRGFTGATGLEPATSGVTGTFEGSDDWRRLTRNRSIDAALGPSAPIVASLE